MSDSIVKMIECPRDAWQGLPKVMPAEVKADYLRVLVAAGFRHIDAVSFVSKTAVPQMADAELVLEYLNPPADVELIGIVLNEKGAQRAVKSGAVATLGFPYSISPAFLQRNANQTPEESLEALEAVGTLAYKAGLDVTAYISMAFGNPYGDPWSIDDVVDACDLLADSGVTQISLADTLGLATPKLVADVLSDVLAVHNELEIGVHLHTRPDTAEPLIRAAYAAGCRRFDSAIGGEGASTQAADALVGNLPTEVLLRVLRELGASLPELTPLDGLLAASAEIARTYGDRIQ
jgi:hydroxymethylglutaryl-CoA lyase